MTAAVLAGGLGKRLQSVISDRPKVLAPVAGRPFLAYLLEQLVQAGAGKAVICTGHLAEQVRATFGGSFGPMPLIYSQEQQPLGTAGALRQALPLLDSDPVLVLNGDSYCDVDIAAFRVSAASLADPISASPVSVRRVAAAPDGSTPGSISSCGNFYPPSRKGSLARWNTTAFPNGWQPGYTATREGSGFSISGRPVPMRRQKRFSPPCRPGQRVPVPANGRRYVLLDRDGTLNVEKNYLSDPAGVELMPGVGQALAALQKIGLGLVVITNQSGVGRGYLDVAQLDRIHARLRELLSAEGVVLDGIYYCPHTPQEGCACRKPSTGLIENAAADLGFDPQRCFVVGDKS
ncbi:MAG: HAD-IIIA family hydrolase, partial [Terriglobales bacterium]